MWLVNMSEYWEVTLLYKEIIIECCLKVHTTHQNKSTSFLIKNKNHKNNNGYTLIETLVALSMLLIIAAPILSGIYKNNHAIDSERIITSIGILEQETRKINANPMDYLPQKKRNVNGKEWVITIEKTGSGVVQYHIVAKLNNKKEGEVYFMEIEK